MASSLVKFEATAAYSLSVAKEYINGLMPILEKETEVKEDQSLITKAPPATSVSAMKSETSSLANFEATTATQLFTCAQRQAGTTKDENKNDSKVHPPTTPLSSTSTSSNVSSDKSTVIDDFSTPTPTASTPLHSSEHKQRLQSTRGLNVSGDIASHKHKHRSSVDKDLQTTGSNYTSNKNSKVSKPHGPLFFKESWTELFHDPAYLRYTRPTPEFLNESANEGPFSTGYDSECIYYPNCTNRNCKFIHPGPDNNPHVKRFHSSSKKQWSIADRIDRQAQSHPPVWKSRCTHWPFCTNNNCKYAHPIKECRMGEECTFKERCMFLHPSDYMEPPRKYGNKRHTLQ
ncbi:hypothetical protein BDF20DRAFT_844038 [Mycotypha africana]|uniref:uncharacterized protein n=1 Tax=Mycotypha africana TaxID=64632 RepID=UPI002301D2FD|nr:uncharacterized protein BDF20DRAFT_844038 [Mycotypha africana]KAI8991322.1 hypothetical protein BDF20DRAFT_844038 [Mycotypha africana]